MTFEFATAARIIFGCGKAVQVPGLARELGRRALVVTGGSGRGADDLADRLEAAGVASVRCRVPGEPTTHLVNDATVHARDAGCDVVVAVGGGSVLDAGKAVAGLLANPGEILDYLEVVGRGQPLAHPGVPLIAVPTTAGTGTEATRNAVLDVPESKVKVSLRSPYLLARVAVIDPDLTRSVPPAITATTGMDALTQLVEPFVSQAANPLTDGLCREGLARVARSLRPAFQDGMNGEAREDMALAALFSGIALANAKLGAVHGFAGVLGGLTGAAHGALCARLLPVVMETNLRAVADRGRPATLERFAEVARILTGNPAARPSDGVDRVRSLCHELNIPPLRELGLTTPMIDAVIPQARRASSMQGNPVPLTDDELRATLEQAL